MSHLEKILENNLEAMHLLAEASKLNNQAIAELTARVKKLEEEKAELTNRIKKIEQNAQPGTGNFFRK